MVQRAVLVHRELIREQRSRSQIHVRAISIAAPELRKSAPKEPGYPL